MISFGSDNHSGIHPRLLEALIRANTGHAPSYGTDDVTDQAQRIFRGIFGPDCETFFVFNGTAANVLALKSLVRGYEAVLCSDMAHLHLDECGAPEAAIGCKLMTIPTVDGKIRAEQIEEALIRRGDQHFAQIAAVSITQPTEVGTVYSLSELAAIREVTRQHDLKMHVDGARLIYAAHFLKSDLAQAAGGADAISFGGTKNGLLFGEAVVFRHKNLCPGFKYIRKQGQQLPSKMRFLSAQFQELLREENGPALWRQIAAHGHDLAVELRDRVQTLTEVEVTQKVQANSVFARIPKEWLKPLRERFFFYVWDEKSWECRWMISFDLELRHVEEFAQHLQTLSKERG